MKAPQVAADGRTLVVCFGNPARGDDAFGALVHTALARLLPPAVHQVHLRGDPLELLDLWHDRGHVILVDVVPSTGRPGAVHVVDLSQASPDTGSDTDLSRIVGASSTHALGPAGVVELARTLGELPRSIHLVVASGREFGLGAAMSPELSDRVQEVAARVARLAQAESCSTGVP